MSIPYERLNALESALGGRAAIQAAYANDRQSLVGGGGGAITSTYLKYVGDRAISNGGLMLTQDDVVADANGVAVEPSGVVFPKGYYAGVLALAVDGITGIPSTDALSLVVNVLALGLATPEVGVEVAGSLGGVAAHINATPLFVSFAFESGTLDVTNLGLTNHGFAVVVGQISVQNETQGGQYAGPLSVANLQLYVQRIGDKA